MARRPPRRTYKDIDVLARVDGKYVKVAQVRNNHDALLESGPETGDGRPGAG